jgi:hypothetical protein
MKPKALFLLVIFLSSSTLCLLNSCDEECSPCDPCPTDPALRFAGAWIIFESFIGGIPVETSVGDRWDFRSSDTLLWFRESSTDTLSWFASDEKLILYRKSQQAALALEYYFEFDTLDTSYLMGDIPVRLRLLEEENMPQPQAVSQ